jgi:putative tricarboxylic transport membrane protein
VTFYVDHGAGGGSDMMARTVVSIIEDLDLVPTNIKVVNKPGTAVGAMYLKSEAGNPHIVFNLNAGFLNQSFTSDADFTISEFTSLPRLCIDPTVFIAKSDSEFKDMSDLIEYAKAHPNVVTVGITTFGNSEHTFVEEIAYNQGVDLNIVPFDSGAEVMAAILGGHIHSTPSNVSEAVGQIDAGKVRALGINTDERVPELENVPTLDELGIEAEYMQFRGYLLAPDVSEEAQEYWEDVFKKVTESEQWKDYMQKNLMYTKFIPSKEHMEILINYESKLEETLKGIGMID